MRFCALLLLLFVLGCFDQFSNKNSSSQGSETHKPLQGNDPLTVILRAGEETKGKIDRAAITKAIQGFQEAEGRNPASLNELVEKKYLPALPHEPAGMKFTYDPASGQFDIVPK